jgi:hypothetical protein
MSYAEQIRHPSEALDPPISSEQEETWWQRRPGLALLVWLAIAGLIVYGLWRANAIQKAAAALGVAAENPFGWV